ncbi:MAG: phage tail assembly protein [Chitinimonas sp.]|nr:phage tail assembly protein [Chitinimonas sp.]
MSQTQAPQTPAAIAPYPLKHPIQTPTGQITTVTMRRAKVRDLRRMPDFGKDDQSQELGLLALLCGMTIEDFDEVDAEDCRALQGTFRTVLGLTPAATVAGNGDAGAVVPVPANGA